jgi:serine/threonine protein kinase
MTGIDFTSIRELKILREVRHNNVIGLRDVFAEKGSLFMALEYMVCDLGKLIDTSNISLNHQEISYIFYHIVKGMNHLHENWILHRVSIEGVSYRF